MKVILYGWCLLLIWWNYPERSEGKLYTKCGLVADLIKYNVPRSFIGVCLVESESYKNTSYITEKGNGAKGLGLFQINSKEWCTFRNKGGAKIIYQNKCNINCEVLLDDDIRDDVECAKKAIDQLGFKAWPGWVNNCKGNEFTTKMPIC